ncbi:DUF7310 family coiled-coil domain-containing protein [Halorarum halobium]|uniref:DUF7310 family coiled-coil domain-containing protein n=1 Tax=Halorarum halobium TaxID=3075121 RepID=UPI0028AE3680|nr:hypothetical protein [Halobaculum sp. XH14]
MTEPPDEAAKRSDRRPSAGEGVDRDSLSARLAAVERALGERDDPLQADTATERARLADRVTAVEDGLADLDERVGEIEAATQALRGYVGGVRAVNRDVERRADAALATAERVASTLDCEAEPRRTDRPPTHEETLRGDADGSARTPTRSPDQDAPEEGTEPTRSDGIAARLRDAL